LPYIFDHPVETAVEWTFHRVFEVLGGPGAIGHTSETGREAALQASNKKALKEKEL
jgi:fission process protein 1